ncbi:BrnT family toxin [Anabaena sphaerica FACHB-251]|uniref:BrnT family toxin n=1 Tax=Anabaena sphaerica FACHB-251 TaxID=2692883 RepID=A0A926WK90_9NOST|nr:BrnT family toxin [Anabaena sphaerica]MBD2296148.1 BrnT family toxin [Anabaena sphaerica FACHB-251]
MEFEFDPNKSATNQTKHNIDFIEAQKLWTDTNRVEIPARTTDEPRFLIIGKIGDKYWSAVITYRSDKIRIISVRRSRTEEVNIYESGRI